MVYFAGRDFTNDIESFLEGMLDIGDEMSQDLEEHKKFLTVTLHRIDLMVDDSNEKEIEECLRMIVHEGKDEYSNPKNLRLEFAINDFIDWFKEAKGTQEVLTGQADGCDDHEAKMVIEV